MPVSAARVVMLLDGDASFKIILIAALQSSGICSANSLASWQTCRWSEQSEPVAKFTACFEFSVFGVAKDL